MSFRFEFMDGQDEDSDDCDCPHHFYTHYGPSRRQSTKCPTKTELLNVTLEDLYKGKKLNHKVTKDVSCKVCKGNGSKKCSTCNGRGKCLVNGPKTKNHKKKNNRIVKDCTKCCGTGKYGGTNVSNCTKCNKTRIVRETVSYNVNILPGMRDGQMITLSGEGDEKDGLEAGDLIFILQCENHNCFKRNGDDLIMEKKIELSGALCGTSMIIEQLDGRKILLTREGDGTIQPGFICKIQNEGMPIPNSNKKFGNMFIKFEVAFPSSYFFKNEELYKELEEALPSKQKVKPRGEEVSLQEYNRRRYQFTNRREAYDSESDEEEESCHFSHPQCPMH
uniref:Chaperone DnaJ C-terminal domain-containing protein n=1 Tax=Panagrolaimus davidi TaxID=227884 RepID=A0A914PJS0_9BILA